MMADGGSVQKIGQVPEDLKELYKVRGRGVGWSGGGANRLGEVHI